MNYTVDFFIKKFKAIPDKNWTAHMYIDDKGRKCALGHCGATTTTRTGEAVALQRLFMNYTDYRAPDTNDGNTTAYQQSTPKKRVLAALEDIKKAMRKRG